MHKSIRKYVRMGPGGKRCACCFPPPGSRREVYRIVKRKHNRDAFKVEFEELDAIKRAE